MKYGISLLAAAAVGIGIACMAGRLEQAGPERSYISSHACSVVSETLFSRSPLDRLLARPAVQTEWQCAGMTTAIPVYSDDAKGWRP